MIQLYQIPLVVMIAFVLKYWYVFAERFSSRIVRVLIGYVMIAIWTPSFYRLYEDTVTFLIGKMQ